MPQVFKFFCFAISALLFLQLANADNPEKTPKDGQDGEENTAPFFKTVEKVTNSRPAKLLRQVTGIAGDQLKTATKKFKSNLNAESKKQMNDENSIVPNVIKNNVIAPVKAAAKTGVDMFGEPVGKIVSSIKDTYEGELEKSEKEENYVPVIGSYTKIANKPVAIFRASKDIVGSTFGNMFGRAKSFWNSSKTDSANKPEKEGE